MKEAFILDLNFLKEQNISPEEFYQLALTEDYRDVFTIEFIIYMPISAEQKIQELLWGIEQVKSYV